MDDHDPDLAPATADALESVADLQVNETLSYLPPGLLARELAKLDPRVTEALLDLAGELLRPIPTEASSN